jgi:hypothetical protein
MKILMIALFLFKSTVGICQFDFYDMGFPNIYNQQHKETAKHSIKSIETESYMDSKNIGNGTTYYDTLGRITCYDNSDSTKRIYYSGIFYYDSSLIKPKKIIGCHLILGGKWEVTFNSVYEKGLLISDSSDKSMCKIHYEYDTLGRDIKELSVFNNSDKTRTILKGYTNNKIAWIKDYFRKAGQEYLDSHKIFYYDKDSMPIKVEELVSNNDNTSNTNRGNREFFNNSKGQLSKMEESAIVYEYEYNNQGLLSKSSFYFKNNFSTNKNRNNSVTYYTYSFY